MNFIRIFLLFVLFMINSTFAQAENVEIFVIDSYVTQEKPYTLVLSFFSTSPVKSEITIDQQYNFIVSDSLAEDHKINVDLTGYEFDSTYVPFIIKGETAASEKVVSQVHEFFLPHKNQLKSVNNTSLVTVCCFGAVIFGLPSPTFVFQDGETKYSVTKELPIFSIYSGGYNYPIGYFSLEYSHIFDTEFKNYLRVGYKQVFEVEPIEFISGGINGFTSFNGFNGFSPEVTIGWFKVYNTFTVYTRYRYNFQPSHSERNFHEISLGLYSNFFSINL